MNLSLALSRGLLTLAARELYYFRARATLYDNADQLRRDQHFIVQTDRTTAKQSIISFVVESKASHIHIHTVKREREKEAAGSRPDIVYTLIYIYTHPHVRVSIHLFGDLYICTTLHSRAKKRDSLAFYCATGYKLSSYSARFNVFSYTRVFNFSYEVIRFSKVSNHAEAFLLGFILLRLGFYHFFGYIFLSELILYFFFCRDSFILYDIDWFSNWKVLMRKKK